MDSTRRRILDHLAEEPHSGPALADQVGITRAAVWKHIEALREEGFEIDGTPDGYRLDALPEYSGAAIAYGLEAPYDIEFRKSVTSTNDIARSSAEDGREDLVVLADEQRAGRGRLGRSWTGPSGGVYASILIRPALPPMEVPLLTLGAAVATAETIADLGLDPKIKWPNDVLLEDRKVAGILTEMEGEADRVSWVIVGIGLNANVEVTDLPEGATSLQAVQNEAIERRTLVQDLLERFHRYRMYPDRVLPAWRDRNCTIGRDVRVSTARGEIEGEAVGIVHPGALRVDTETGTVDIHAGDCEHLRPTDH